MTTKAKTTTRKTTTRKRSSTTTKAAPKTTRRKSTAKPATATAKAATKPAAKSATNVTSLSPAISPAPAAEATAEPAKVMRRAELVEQTATRGDLRKNQVRSVLDSALAVIGEALARGETLILPGLGKVSVQRIKDKEHARLIIAKVRQEPGPAKPADTPATAEGTAAKTALEAVRK